jgi:hypothetical protein
MEAGGANRSYLRPTLALERGNQRAAFVTSFNGVLAGLAVRDVIMQLLLGYASALSVRMQYDALDGTVAEMIVSKRAIPSDDFRVLASLSQPLTAGPNNGEAQGALRRCGRGPEPFSMSVHRRP